MKQINKQSKAETLDVSLIKNHGPRKNSYYHQGVFSSKNFKKVFESCKNENIIYRSGLEYNFIRWCESSDRVVRWASEPICITYTSRKDNKIHRYYPDFLIEDNNGIKYIVEVKPFVQTQKPGPNASRYDKEAWIKNTDKWKYAVEFAKKQPNTKFIIVTEKFFERIGTRLV